MARGALALGLLLLAAQPAAGDGLSGRVSVTAKGGKLLGAEELADVVVWFRPAAPVATRPAADPVPMTTRDKEFFPRVLPVTVGSTVRFPNEDPILHNVFSVTPGNAFDIGLVGKGEGGEATFREAGVVRIFCNVHHSMVAHVVVLDTPFHASPRADGSFELADVPPGPGRLTAFHPRAELLDLDLAAVPAAPIDLSLVVTQRRVPKHVNKLGQPYGEAPVAGYP